MNKEKIIELLNKDEAPTREEILDATGIDSIEKLKDLFVSALVSSQYVFNDSLGTSLIETIFEENKNGTFPIITEDVSIGTLFVTTFSDFDYEFFRLCVFAFGMSETAFLVDFSLKKNDRYAYLRERYQDYKQLFYFREYRNIMASVDELISGMQNEIDKDSLAKLSKEIEKVQEKLK